MVLRAWFMSLWPSSSHSTILSTWVSEAHLGRLSHVFPEETLPETPMWPTDTGPTKRRKNHPQIFPRNPVKESRPPIKGSNPHGRMGCYMVSRWRFHGRLTSPTLQIPGLVKENHGKTIGKWRFTLWLWRLQFANWNMVIEIVDLPSYKMVDLSRVMVQWWCRSLMPQPVSKKTWLANPARKTMEV